MKLSTFALTLCMTLCAFSVVANSEIKDNFETLRSNDNMVGTWDYTVPGVDPMYATGIMHVAKEQDTYVVQLQVGDSMVPTEDVEVNGNEIKFAVYVEGSRVTLDLVFDGDTMTGSGSSDQGPFTLSGTRKALPE